MFGELPMELAADYGKAGVSPELPVENRKSNARLSLYITTPELLAIRCTIVSSNSCHMSRNAVTYWP